MKRASQKQVTVNGNKQYSDRLYEKGDKLRRAVIKEYRQSNVTIVVMYGEGTKKKNGEKFIVSEYRTSIIPNRLIDKFNTNDENDINELWWYDTPNGSLDRALGRSRVV